MPAQTAVKDIRGHIALRLAVSLFVVSLIWASAGMADIARFVGTYSGSAMVTNVDGTAHHRDMSVEISETKKGFVVQWTSTRYRTDGSEKAKSYKINFQPSDRGNVFAAAMGKNVFGHDVQLDPMQGEPYVWARLVGDTLSVFSLFVTDIGGYELQQYDRTLVDEGLQLDFKRLSNGLPLRSVTTLLTRE